MTRGRCATFVSFQRDSNNSCRIEQQLSHTTATVQRHLTSTTMKDKLFYEVPLQQSLQTIASFLSESEYDNDSSYAIGLDLVPSHPSLSTLETPDTPGLVALSPGEYAAEEHENSDICNIQYSRKLWAQQGLVAALFAQPTSLRSYCWVAYQKAQELRGKRRNELQLLDTLVQIPTLPPAVAWQTAAAGTQLSVDVIVAVLTLHHRAWSTGWHLLTRLHPVQMLEALIHWQFHAVNKTSEVLASGLQSVATVSASHMFLRGQVDDKDLLHKMSQLNDTAPVVAYHEYDNTNLSQTALHRTRRMMHYSVSLKPFVATVVAPSKRVEESEVQPMTRAPSASQSSLHSNDEQQDDTHSPLLCCTPQSFPPTPHSRHMLLLQKFQDAEDDIFHARDRLRVTTIANDENSDERSRTVSQALLRNGLRAVWDETVTDIRLSCGRHVAHLLTTTASNLRCMIPLLHNCWQYFEVTVLPAATDTAPPALTVGLATHDLPSHLSVGAWQASTGLVSRTGQCTWWSRAGHAASWTQTYGAAATVGVCVYIDTSSTTETWDGLMVVATVHYSVNGQTVEQVEWWLPASEDVYPTVTLQSHGTAVLCRFSAEDMVSTVADLEVNDDEIVYCMDGSLLAQQE